jgi:hypothetical protein
LVLQKKSDGAPYIHKIKKKERCVFHNFWQWRIWKKLISSYWSEVLEQCSYRYRYRFQPWTDSILWTIHNNRTHIVYSTSHFIAINTVWTWIKVLDMAVPERSFSSRLFYNGMSISSFHCFYRIFHQDNASVWKIKTL